MSRREHCLDLVAATEDKESELVELEDELEQIELDALEEDEDSDDYSELEDEWKDTQSKIIELRGEIRKFRESVVSWNNEIDLNEFATGKSKEEYWDQLEQKYREEDECVVTIKELTYGQLQSVNDEMMEHSFDVDVETQDISGSPKSGVYQIAFLEKAIVDWPEYAPTKGKRRGRKEPSPGDYPIPVAEWIYGKVDAYNTTGDADMGNLSMKKALKSRR